MTYLRRDPDAESRIPQFPEIKQQFGFVPNFYRAQVISPDHLMAEFNLVNTILIEERALTRKQKEYIFLVCSAANLSTYCVTAHCEIIRMLGISGPDPEEIAINHREADIDDRDKALLDYCRKLTMRPADVTSKDVEILRGHGFDDARILEAVLMVGLAKFANYVAFGLGTVPDFDNPRVDYPGGAKRTVATT